MSDKSTHKLFSLIFILFTCFSLFVLNAKGEIDPSAKALEAFGKAYPGTAVKSIKRSKINGLFEVVSGGNILYYAPEGNYLVIGEIFTPDGKSITGQSMEEMTAHNLKNLPFDDAVKIGSGKNIVIEFTDPDCPYCRKVEPFFNKRQDVTRYVFFAPLVQLHPNAEKKSARILSAGNREKEYHDVMAGKHDKDVLPQPDEQAMKRVMKHRQMASNMGVMGTPMFWVNGRMVQGANLSAIEKLLTEGGETTR